MQKPGEIRAFLFDTNLAECGLPFPQGIHMKTIELTDVEVEALRDLLSQAVMDASCAGCNDFFLPNTEEGRALNTEAHKYASVDEAPEANDDDDEVYSNDMILLMYLKHKICGDDPKDYDYEIDEELYDSTEESDESKELF